MPDQAARIRDPRCFFAFLCAPVDLDLIALYEPLTLECGDPEDILPIGTRSPHEDTA